jgi:hypothetical protein
LRRPLEARWRRTDEAVERRGQITLEEKKNPVGVRAEVLKDAPIGTQII